MNKIVEGLQDVARRDNSKILYCHVKNLREISQFGLVPFKDRNRVSISDEVKVEERWAKHCKNGINPDKVMRNGIEKNEKFGALRK